MFNLFSQYVLTAGMLFLGLFLTIFFTVLAVMAGSTGLAVGALIFGLAATLFVTYRSWWRFFDPKRGNLGAPAAPQKQDTNA